MSQPVDYVHDVFFRYSYMDPDFEEILKCIVELFSKPYFFSPPK